MLYDSHTHFNDLGYSDEERQAVLAAADKAVQDGILTYSNDIGCDLETSLLAVKHSEAYPWCYATVGYHPHDAQHMGEDELLMIKMLAKKEKVKAIGEIRLDFYRNHSPHDVQREVFRKQIRLANELKMPIVIHEREAGKEVMDILIDEGAFSDERKSWFPMRPDGGSGLTHDARVLIHCYSGSRETAEQYVRLGATISIAGPVTYKNSRKLVQVAREIPIEFLTIETDAPFLTPEPLRGKRNQSQFVEHVARKIAELKEMQYEDVARITCENAKRFFDIE